MRAVPVVLSVFSLSLAAAYACQRQKVQSASSPAISVQLAPGPSEFPCENRNVFSRFFGTGNIECQRNITIDFTDASGRPFYGAIYRLFVEAYISIPVGSLVKDTLVHHRDVVIPQQTFFVKAQLVDDPDNKNPLEAAVKLTPKLNYTFDGMCSIKLEDLDVTIDEIKSQDLGNLGTRLPAVAHSVLMLYKDRLIATIQGSLDAMAGSNYCWYYRRLFHNQDLAKGQVPTVPSESEKASVMVTPAPESEIPNWFERKWTGFKQRLECSLSTKC